MKSYLSYFKLKIITGLQYKASAIAGSNWVPLHLSISDFTTSKGKESL